MHKISLEMAQLCAHEDAEVSLAAQHSTLDYLEQYRDGDNETFMEEVRVISPVRDKEVILLNKCSDYSTKTNGKKELLSYFCSCQFVQTGFTSYHYKLYLEVYFPYIVLHDVSTKKE